ncbi:MAG TPA: hydroxymethylbilane synthase [Fulvivirga sp.]|nr:hydroxymethylbilane synthase [Fulvivirga sp.]
MNKIKIGTRGSKLALWQAYHVQTLLKAKNIESEIIPFETKGDKILDVSIAKIGSKGVFTEEIEEQLAAGIIDIAVHSAKDMQSELPDGFELIAFTERELVNDVLLSKNKEANLNQPNIVIGTSSTRRVSMLRHLYPHVKTVPVRGNLQTRIARMEEGTCDALLLAYAGMYRMGYSSLMVQKLSIDEFTPAVGQGSITVECCTSLDPAIKSAVKNAVTHAPSESRLICERAFLRKLQGGCSIPVFGLATLNNNEITIKGGVVSLDGKEIIRKEITGQISDAETIGTKLAEEVLAAGGDRILKEIRVELEG